MLAAFTGLISIHSSGCNLTFKQKSLPVLTALEGLRYINVILLRAA
jgi:hypothetical protein